MGSFIVSGSSTGVAEWDPIPATLTDPLADASGVTTRTSTIYSYLNDDGTITRVNGTGFTYDGSGNPTGGSVTQVLHLSSDGNTQYANVSGFTAGVTDNFVTIFGFVQSGDDTGLTNYIFSQSDAMVSFDGDGQEFNGSSGSDVITTGGGNDTVNGGAGNDVIVGRAGNDILNGDDGNDIIVGSDGEDTINGGNGEDNISGNALNDTLDGGAGNDFIFGNDGNDFLEGGDGDDQLRGAGGTDTLSGGNGDDVLRGGGGIDILTGGDGADSLGGGAANDTLTGGAGNDIFDYTFVTGGAGIDTITDFQGAGAAIGDRINVVGRFADFTALQAALTDDGLGNAVVTLGASDKIVINGVTAATLVAGDFIF